MSFVYGFACGIAAVYAVSFLGAIIAVAINQSRTFADQSDGSPHAAPKPTRAHLRVVAPAPPQ